MLKSRHLQSFTILRRSYVNITDVKNDNLRESLHYHCIFTWKSSMDGSERWVVRRRCHWWSVSLVSELSALAACSSWKFLIRDIAPKALVR